MEQDYAQITGECVVDDIGPEKAGVLADLIRQQPNTPTTGWGEPVVVDGRVRAMLRRGPMKGAWPSDLRRSLLKLVANVGGSAEVTSTKRIVLTPRAACDVPATDKPVEDYAAVLVEAHALSAQQEATYRAMGSPDVARFPEPLMVKVGDEVHGIYPDGRVQTPRDGRPRSL